jgi:hypothetical protein
MISSIALEVAIKSPSGLNTIALVVAIKSPSGLNTIALVVAIKSPSGLNERVFRFRIVVLQEMGL